MGPWLHVAAKVHTALGQMEAGAAWRIPPATLRPLEWLLLRDA